MDVHFSIFEGNVIYVERVRVEGNKTTKTYALRREIITNPGDPFSAKKVKRSREMLMNLGFLDSVNVDIQSPDDPNEVDLTYDVVEGKPGMMTAGGAYSSIMGLFGTLSLTNMNFLGRAQKLSANWSFGQRILMYSVNWSTPFVGNSPTSLGISLFDSMQISPFGGSLYAYTLYSKGATVIKNVNLTIYGDPDTSLYLVGTGVLSAVISAPILSKSPRSKRLWMS